LGKYDPGGGKGMEDFSDQVVVVTGAAGALGGALAGAFRQAGANLVLVDIDDQKLRDRYPQAAEPGSTMMTAECDLSDPGAVNGLRDRIRERWGRVDVLANIAGGFRAGQPVHETDPETWHFMLDLNATSAFLTSRALIPMMLEQSAGKIINVAARPGLKAGAGNAAYAAAKSAVIRLTESLASELRHHGINVNAVMPGTMDTPGNRVSMPEADSSKWVQLQAVTDVILFLASDRARAIHGAIIPVLGLT
jgi:NAD(P)-dependent dehydrogenase (short-subunit alcohol dehydrogenase family)